LVVFFAIEEPPFRKPLEPYYNTEVKHSLIMDDARTHNLIPTTQPQPGWVLKRAARDLWRTLRDDCRAIPSRVWWRWGVTLAVGFIGCLALSYGVTRYAYARVDEGLQAWDKQWLLWLAERGPISFPNAVLLESPGNLAYLIPLTLTASIIAIRKHRPLIAITIQVAYWLQRPIVLLGWETWNRPRPKLIGDGIAAPGLHSFPSGHAALCVAVYGFLGYLWITSSRSAWEKLLAVILVAVLTALVSLARVRLGSHWPTDIIAGALLGVAWVGVVILAYRTAAHSVESRAL
jgi:membrane-associated phospholipid phosphatase